MCDDGGGGNATRVPYQPGTELRLEVVQDCCVGGVPFPATVSAVVVQMLSMTMSPVMDVVIPDGRADGRTDAPNHYVLKLYDRRFGRDLRKVDGKYVPHTPADEAVYRAAVCRGDMTRILRELDDDTKAALLPPGPWCYLDGSTAGRAKYEAALWRECRDAFASETGAYARLRPLQGCSVPRLYAHVRLAARRQQENSSRSRDRPADLAHPGNSAPDPDPYLEIPGILLELVPGYCLWDLPTAPWAPRDPRAWRRIVQAAIDVVCDINRRGVLLDDCAPRNMLVRVSDHDEPSSRVDQTSSRRRRSHPSPVPIPVVVDFAHSSFRDELVEQWREDGSIDEVDVDGSVDGSVDGNINNNTHNTDENGLSIAANIQYWELVRDTDNHGAIGDAMTQRVERVLGADVAELPVIYPDYDHIIENLYARAEGG